MTVSIRLLERFTPATATTSASHHPSRVQESIRANVEELLNSVMGSTPAHPGLGMPARCELVQMVPDDTRIIARLIGENITAFEPRLEGVDVAELQLDSAGDLRVHFRCSGVVREAGRRAVTLLVVLDEQGRFKVAVKD